MGKKKVADRPPCPSMHPFPSSRTHLPPPHATSPNSWTVMCEKYSDSGVMTFLRREESHHFASDSSTHSVSFYEIPVRTLVTWLGRIGWSFL
jgi:hypothetical protein